MIEIHVEAPPYVSNPFCTRFVRPGVIPYLLPLGGAQPASTDKDALAQITRLADQIQQTHFSLIVGPHGSGKSTLIASLHSVLADSGNISGCKKTIGRVQLCDDANSQNQGRFKFWTRWRSRRQNHLLVRQHQRGLPVGAILIVDGLEQLSAWSRVRLRLTAVVSHQHLLGTSHHDLPGFKTIYRTQLTADLIVSLTERLLIGVEPTICQAVWHHLESCDLSRVSNLRDFWFELYDAVNLTMSVDGDQTS